MIRIKKYENKNVLRQISICENPTVGTWGSLQLYKEELKILEIESTKPKWLTDLLFNEKFLTNVLNTYGELHCEYCGRENLKIYYWGKYRKPKDDVATADHFLPKSKYPELSKDITNLIVSCKKCNNKKGDKIIDKSKIKYPYGK